MIEYPKQQVKTLLIMQQYIWIRVKHKYLDQFRLASILAGTIL